MAEAPRSDMRELIPWQQDGGDASEGGCLLEVAEAKECEDEVTFLEQSDKLFPNCLYIPGLCHIVHNIALALSEQLTQFAFFKQRLKSLCMLLGHRHCRERFVKLS